MFQRNTEKRSRWDKEVNGGTKARLATPPFAHPGGTDRSCHGEVGRPAHTLLQKDKTDTGVICPCGRLALCCHPACVQKGISRPSPAPHVGGGMEYYVGPSTGCPLGTGHRADPMSPLFLAICWQRATRLQSLNSAASAPAAQTARPCGSACRRKRSPRRRSRGAECSQGPSEPGCGCRCRRCPRRPAPA